MRPSGRAPGELRPVTIERDYTRYAEGSVLIACGQTRILCTASVEDRVPFFLRGSGNGWVTAEYGMLPGSSPQRIRRDAYTGGRSKEISRLIGRALRSVVRLEGMEQLTIRVDCDVLQADGGTRTAAITGAWVALHDALAWAKEQGLVNEVPILDQLAAISVGLVDGRVLLDLEYVDDVAAEVDLNVVMTGRGLLVEVQGTAEGQPFTRRELEQMLDVAEQGIRELLAVQQEMVGA